jgi:flagellar hook-associated protein 2
MASTSLQVAGLASDFDWKSFTDQIMELERAPANRLESEKTSNSQKVSQLSTFGTRLTALQSSASALKADGLFSKRTAASAASSGAWSASAAADTATGSYKITVTQLATAASLTGTSDIGRALNPGGDDVSTLTVATLPISQAVTAGTFTVNGKQVSVALSDSLEDVFDKIATATGGDVTATYDHTSDRISLTSSNGNVVLGAANDTSNFLRALKLGNNGTDTVTSSAKLGAVKTGATLANANLSGTITAVDGTGAGTFTINGVEIAYNVNTDTLTAVLKRINDSTAGVSAAYDAANDRLVLTNKATGDVGISVAEASGGLLGALGATSGTTFTRGKNAEFTLNDGDTLSSASNTLDASAHGIAGLSVTVKAQETQTITVAADTTTMRGKIEKFIEDFNAVQSFLETQTRISTDSKGKVTAGILASNREIQEWGRSLRTMAFASIGGAGTVKRLNDLGLDFKNGTNELEIEDGAALAEALTNASGDVGAFFATASTGFAAKFDAFLEKVTEQNSEQQKRLNEANTDLDDQIAAIDRRLEQQRTLMESAFIQMENAQSKIKQQQSAISSMISSFSSGQK